jgi:hypothetical protein
MNGAADPTACASRQGEVAVITSRSVRLRKRPPSDSARRPSYAVDAGRSVPAVETRRFEGGTMDEERKQIHAFGVSLDGYFTGPDA